MIRRPPRSPLFPYPPLFRSRAGRGRRAAAGRGGGVGGPHPLPVARRPAPPPDRRPGPAQPVRLDDLRTVPAGEVVRSEEHTSELQSRQYLVCRLLLEKKKTK